MPEPDVVPPALADHVDAWWDAFLRGAPSAADPLAPELTSELRRLHAADRTPHADPAFLARLGGELEIGSSAPLASPPISGSALVLPPNGRTPAALARPIVVVPIRRPRWRVWNAVATAVMLVVTVLAASTVSRLAAPDLGREGSVGDARPTPDLLVSEGGKSAADRFVHLDPLTLADRTADLPLDLDAPTWGTVLSADGSTLVTVAVPQNAETPFPKRTIFTIRDGRTGAYRTRFELPLSLDGPAVRLSRDGGRLVLGVMPDGEFGPGMPAVPLEWHVVDTTTGSTLATVPSDPEGRWSAETWIDPDARRLYRLLPPYWPDRPGPGPVTLVAHDLATGSEIGRLDVAEVRGGTWDTGRTSPNPAAGALPESLPIIGELRPAGALSPDGRRLALVHADGDRVTLVDVERLVVERTVAFGRKQGVSIRLLALLGFAPHGAAAKTATDGTRLDASFAADGRHLYVWGDETAVAEDGRVTGGALPLRLIDIQRGTLVAEADRGALIDVKPATDGSGVYAVASLPDDPDRDDDPPMLLQRLDPMTLDVRAERTFDGFPTLILRPAVPNGSDVTGV